MQYFVQENRAKRGAERTKWCQREEKVVPKTLPRATRRRSRSDPSKKQYKKQLKMLKTLRLSAKIKVLEGLRTSRAGPCICRLGDA